MSRDLSLTALSDRVIAKLRKVSPPSIKGLVPTTAQRRRMRLVRPCQETPDRSILGSPARQAINVVRSVLPVATTTQEVWAVTMVKNEADVIGLVIEHLLEEGVDRVLVADNDSTDGTSDLLAELAQHAPVSVIGDHLVAYYQAEKMIRLARFATRAGAAWIIPFDADEWWLAPDAPLGDFLRRSRSDVLTAEIYDHVPQPDDPTEDEEPNPFKRLGYRIAEPTGMNKVAFRGFAPARLSQGNHSVRRFGRRSGGLEIRHFPYRSPEHFMDKTRTGAIAWGATDLPSHLGTHMRTADNVEALEKQWCDWSTGRPLVFDPAIA